MRGFGGLVTFLVKDADWRQTAAVVDAVQIPRIGPSLGGVESLIEQPLVMSYFECTPEERRRYGIPDNMIRLACGIENHRGPGGRSGTGRSNIELCNFAPGPFMSATSAIRKPARSCRHCTWPSTFVQPGSGEWGEFDYSRSGNPTRKALETTLASIWSRACGALAFASGMAAIHCVTMLLESGDHIVAGIDIYGGTFRLLHKIVNRSGIGVSLVPTVDLEVVAAAITPRTRVAVDRNSRQPAAVDHRHRRVRRAGASPWSVTGRRQYVCHAGADAAARTGSRHRDALGHEIPRRAIATCWEACWWCATRSCSSGCISFKTPPAACWARWDAYLCSRGLKTLELRVREQCRTAQRLAEYLAEQPGGPRALPGTEDPPRPCARRARQMDGAFGAMVSFEIRGRFRGRQAVGGIDPAVPVGGQPGGRGIADRAAGRHVARQL